MINLETCTDHQFWVEWRSLSDIEKAAFPDDVRAKFYARFNKISPFKSDSRYERAAERGKQYLEESAAQNDEYETQLASVIHIDPAGPTILGPDDYYEAVDALWEAGLPKGAKTGWSSLDSYYTVAPGQMTILTGWPGSGKSEWLDHLMINLTAQNWKFAVFSAENLPVELHIAKLLEKRLGLPFSEGPRQRIPRDELSEHCIDLANNFRFICQQERAVNLDDIIKSANQWLLTDDGRKRGLVIDPWNEVEHNRPRHIMETEYISQSLSRVRNWGRQNGVHIWLVAHPAKQARDEGLLPIPKPDMISGSQHWWNKADCALTVYRQPVDEGSAFANQVEIHIQKIRFKNIGKLGKVTLNYDKVTGRYTE